MAFKLLKTDYVDAVFEGLRRYMIGDNGDGTVSFIDVTNYTVREGAFFGAKDANTINTAVNAILAALNNGTDLYDVFTMFFETQKTLFEAESDAKQEGFAQYITELRTYMDGKWNELKDEYTGDIQYFKDVQENAFNVWFQMVRDQLTNDVAGHLQTQIGNLQELGTENTSNLVDAINEVNETTAKNETIGDLDALKTSKKDNIVSAVNEVKDSVSTSSAKNEEAIKALDTKIKGLENSSGVTGVKGKNESTYRKGNVNLTPANIGALPDSTVPVSKGGTGQSTAVNAANALINALSTGSDAPKDNDYFISQYVNGGTKTITYHRRPLSKLWEYVKSKINAATDIKATQDSNGNVIKDTYARKDSALNLVETGQFTNETITIPLKFDATYMLVTREVTINTGKVHGYRARLYATPTVANASIAPSAANLAASSNAGVTLGTNTIGANQMGYDENDYAITLKATATYQVSYALYEFSNSYGEYAKKWSGPLTNI